MKLMQEHRFRIAISSGNLEQSDIYFTYKLINKYDLPTFLYILLVTISTHEGRFLGVSVTNHRKEGEGAVLRGRFL